MNMRLFYVATILMAVGSQAARLKNYKRNEDCTGPYIAYDDVQPDECCWMPDEAVTSTFFTQMPLDSWGMIHNGARFGGVGPFNGCDGGVLRTGMGNDFCLARNDGVVDYDGSSYALFRNVIYLGGVDGGSGGLVQQNASDGTRPIWDKPDRKDGDEDDGKRCPGKTKPGPDDEVKDFGKEGKRKPCKPRWPDSVVFEDGHTLKTEGVSEADMKEILKLWGKDDVKWDDVPEKLRKLEIESDKVNEKADEMKKKKEVGMQKVEFDPPKQPKKDDKKDDDKDDEPDVEGDDEKKRRMMRFRF
ncbi:hypothetical protein B0H66DRAFT_546103 [Apodospora peruviana]|uniref:Uncharacterized protein n=1 Tax=Apodospora peruviana TaxID=516989 RepID=A0AAE0IUJ1_9PEZI|nr:hypothetical protein B0H66DRAFT_546103 [Apodospora peruviana]